MLIPTAELAAAPPPATCDAASSSRLANQGRTLVHFSAQPKPFGIKEPFSVQFVTSYG